MVKGKMFYQIKKNPFEASGPYMTANLSLHFLHGKSPQLAKRKTNCGLIIFGDTGLNFFTHPILKFCNVEFPDQKT